MDRGKTTKYNLALFLLAVLIILIRASFLNSNPDPLIVKHVGEKISFTGEIIKEPDERDISTRYTVSIDDSSSKIILVTPLFPKYNYGDKVEVTGKLALPENFQADNGTEFDYVGYLSKDHIHFLMYQPEIEVLESGGNFLFKNLFKLKNKFVAGVARVVPEPNSSLIAGLIFGAKSSLGENLLTEMKNVGLIHIVAISGYNVTIIAVSILYLASYLKRRNLGLLLSALSIILFAIMVGLGSTVIRASLMAVIAILARYFGRPNDALRALFAAVFLMLLSNPLLLTRDPSFQLSVMATLGLILFSPIIYNFVSKKISWIPEKWSFREIVSSTFAVQIFLLPLLIKMSGIFSLISFVINLVVLPILPLAMLLGFLTGFVGLFSFYLSWPFGALGYLITEFIIKSVEISSHIPFAFLQIGHLPTGFLIIWYTFYAWAFLKLTKRTTNV